MIAATEERNRPRRMFNVPNHLVKLMRGNLFARACVILSVAVESSYTNRVVITIQHCQHPEPKRRASVTGVNRPTAKLPASIQKYFMTPTYLQQRRGGSCVGASSPQSCASNLRGPDARTGRHSPSLPPAPCLPVSAKPCRIKRAVYGKNHSSHSKFPPSAHSSLLSPSFPLFHPIFPPSSPLSSFAAFHFLR